MSVETIQCVKCGANLDVSSAITIATCEYCGSTLRISRGSSGHLVAALEGIKSDTQVIAAKAALDSVQDSLQTALQARERIVLDIYRKYEPNRTMSVIILTMSHSV